MKFGQILLLLITLFISSNFIVANEDKEEARPEVRLEAAKKILLDSSSISLIYVEGLVCPSCAIGIRKNLSKMLGVDRTRFKDGIDMNPETQLVTIAFKEGISIDNKDLIELVEDAGYTAIEEYKLHEGHVDALQFKHDASVKIVHHTHK
jgi:copper chaperone CopZ